MYVLLIKDGSVENCISADSVERAQQFYPDYTCIERTSSVGPGWKYINGSFVEPEPIIIPGTYKITKLAFLTRFTDMEAIGIDMASQGATVEAASVRRYLSKVNNAEYIDLERVDTRTGVLQLEELGFLTAGRALQILNTPAQPHEIYKGAE